ncbi:hydroxyethylthiazole kinase [Virgibacillus doumboii]|uniref:hydroxyethylthiazole kinase n=1 Tax=Virgibacillus doumboii TaxID=2697503 RepID=UPI0013DFDFD7|nr:hydroxyethylthiazole kinase [Virgibacillus doumboii]
MDKNIINKVRENQPLIHHLTNQVVMNFTANGLLSFGGTPVMAKSEEEASDMAAIADGVLLNIGTVTAPDIPAMIAAGQAANENEIPVVLDPVGVAATPFRTTAVKRILKEVNPTVIKGNAGELAHLVQIPWKTKGVESVGDGNPDEIAMKVAKTYQTAAIVTGKTDVICSGGEVLHNDTGNPNLGRITGAGCLLGSVLTACLTTEDSFNEQALAAVEFYGLAADFAANQTNVNGPGTFIPRFMDALSLEPEELERG